MALSFGATVLIAGGDVDPCNLVCSFLTCSSISGRRVPVVRLTGTVLKLEALGAILPARSFLALWILQGAIVSARTATPDDDGN
jgi:hypothetical protein